MRLDVFNVLGQRLATLVDAERSAGDAHTAQWDGTDAAGRAVGAGGVYLPVLSSGGMTESRRMVLVRMGRQAGIPARGSGSGGRCGR